MLIGYARVSSDDQNLNLQKDALTRAGCERILEDRQSGAKADRPGLRDALDYARDGDNASLRSVCVSQVGRLSACRLCIRSIEASINLPFEWDIKEPPTRLRTQRYQRSRAAGS